MRNARTAGGFWFFNYAVEDWFASLFSKVFAWREIP